MIRRFFFAAIFGTLVAIIATRLGATAGSPVQAVLVGLLSAMGFLTATVISRGRLRRRQGEAPVMLAGETALLYGPGEVIDEGGRAKAWLYLSNLRLMARGDGAEGLNLKLSEIEELRPPKPGWFSGELALVAKGRGLITLSVPDAKRWHGALQKALHPA